MTDYPIITDRKVRTRIITGWGYRPFYGCMSTTTSRVRHHKEGTIVIELVDFKSNQLIWQGAATGALTRLGNPDDADQVVPRAVRDILEKFPPK